MTVPEFEPPVKGKLGNAMAASVIPLCNFALFPPVDDRKPADLGTVVKIVTDIMRHAYEIRSGKGTVDLEKHVLDSILYLTTSTDLRVVWFKGRPYLRHIGDTVKIVTPRGRQPVSIVLTTNKGDEYPALATETGAGCVFIDDEAIPFTAQFRDSGLIHFTMKKDVWKNMLDDARVGFSGYGSLKDYTLEERDPVATLTVNFDDETSLQTRVVPGNYTLQESAIIGREPKDIILQDNRRGCSGLADGWIPYMADYIAKTVNVPLDRDVRELMGVSRDEERIPLYEDGDGGACGRISRLMRNRFLDMRLRGYAHGNELFGVFPFRELIKDSTMDDRIEDLAIVSIFGSAIVSIFGSAIVRYNGDKLDLRLTGRKVGDMIAIRGEERPRRNIAIYTSEDPEEVMEEVKSRCAARTWTEKRHHMFRILLADHQRGWTYAVAIVPLRVKEVIGPVLDWPHSYQLPNLVDDWILAQYKLDDDVREEISEYADVLDLSRIEDTDRLRIYGENLSGEVRRTIMETHLGILDSQNVTNNPYRKLVPVVKKIIYDEYPELNKSRDNGMMHGHLEHYQPDDDDVFIRCEDGPESAYDDILILPNDEMPPVYLDSSNDEVAAGWYRLAADESDDSTMHHLGLLFEHASDVEKSREEAADSYRPATEQGYVPALDPSSVIGDGDPYVYDPDHSLRAVVNIARRFYGQDVED